MNEEEIKITTTFDNFSEVPPKLKKIFKLEKNKNKSWINLDTGAFIPFALSANFNPRPLLIMGCSIIGGGIGSIINIYGTIIGAMGGLLIAFIAIAFNKNKNYEVKVKVNKNSNLIIITKPE